MRGTLKEISTNEAMPRCSAGIPACCVADILVGRTLRLTFGVTQSAVQAGKHCGTAGRNACATRLGSSLHKGPSCFSFSVGGFTLVELLLVMTIMVAGIAIAAPTLAGFFRGRTLDSEARRLLALTHSGQSRAISEGIPTRLWLDTAQHTYGLQQDPGWSDTDPKAQEFSFDQELQIDVVHQDKPQSVSSRSRMPPSLQAKANPRNLPEIRFLPDGSVDETSPLAFHLQDRSGTSLWLAQATNHLSYEIRDSYN